MKPEDVFSSVPPESSHRWANAMVEMTSGYGTAPSSILTATFGSPMGGLIVLRDIPFVSVCEHHLFPFTGTATVGYVPDVGVLGISKLARLVDCVSKRFQLQENMTIQIAEALMHSGFVRGAGCVVKAEHSCMSCRGVQKSGTTMVTSQLLGVVSTDPLIRSEFRSLS